MKIQFYGAAQTVTGTKHLLTLESGYKVLLDCGMFQGMGEEGGIRNHNFGFRSDEIDCVILSHAHIDHSGLLPKLCAEGFKGPIYCTPATADLCNIMLRDSAHIQESDLKNLNKRRLKRNEPPIEPLYTEEDVDLVAQSLITVKYQQQFEINPGIKFFFSDQGHILGSAAINITITEKNRTFTLMFSGDIGRPEDKILIGPEPFPQSDYIICESTYGNKLHESSENAEQRLLDIVKQTCVDNKGKLIIPAFSIDRTQELVFALDRMSHQGLLPSIKVYVDSPLSVKATNIMRTHRECYNQNLLNYLKTDEDPFGFPNLEYISDVNRSKELNESNEPCIIISASGMAEAGRVKHHIANNIRKKNTTILIVGYCSPQSLGGALKRGDREVRIFGDMYPVIARVEIIDSYSAHADYREMINYLLCQETRKVKKLFLVHGVIESQEPFRARLMEQGFSDVYIPAYKEEVII
jgi:metallo-beta-lactamase family protein